jgi:hypothetical protein
MDHKSLQLVGLVALHGKEDLNLQILYMVVLKHHLKIFM